MDKTRIEIYFSASFFVIFEIIFLKHVFYYVIFIEKEVAKCY